MWVSVGSFVLFRGMKWFGYFVTVVPAVDFMMSLRGKSVRSWCDGSSDRSFMVDP